MHQMQKVKYFTQWRKYHFAQILASPTQTQTLFRNMIVDTWIQNTIGHQRTSDKIQIFATLMIIQDAFSSPNMM